MLSYIIRRLLFMVPVFLGVTLVVFLMLHLAPGDPVILIAGEQTTPEAYKQIREELGLNRPLYEQYFSFLQGLLRGDLGMSLLRRRPVAELIKEAMPVTIELSLAGLVVSYLIGVPVGILSAVKRDSLLDQAGMVAALVFVCVPTFWLGLFLMYIFSVQLRMFPVSGYGGWYYLVLPSLALGLGGAALTARLTRSSMLEVIRQDYIQTARAKGLPGYLVVFKHAFKNALIPIITLLGLRLGWLVGGSISLEIVFSRPGMGRLMVNSILSRDYPVVQGVTLVLAACVMLGNLLADILYAAVDPRIRLK